MLSRCFSALILCSFLTHAGLAQNKGAEWNFKTEFWPELVRSVPEILRSQDPKTGRFGAGIWIVNDQHPIFPLAVAWALPHPSNPFYHRKDVLEAVMAGGDALIDDQDEKGMWMFRKKDGSTWGKIYQHWTYTRWIRAFGLVREGMPPARRARWEKALTLGYEGISRTALDRLHNIPAHHAMGLYLAGKLLGRPEWSSQAKEFLGKICASQNPGGYWPEHGGPAVSYNFVYSDAAGIYHAMSGDAAVLPALNRASLFHAAFTYPDGSRVETIDGRNPYHPGVRLGTVGFTFSPEGRTSLLQQWRRLLRTAGKLDADDAAAFILYGEEGPLKMPFEEPAEFRSVLGKNDAVVERRAPWFVCAFGASERPCSLAAAERGDDVTRDSFRDQRVAARIAKVTRSSGRASNGSATSTTSNASAWRSSTWPSSRGSAWSPKKARSSSTGSANASRWPMSGSSR